jgi:hypothetical protein
MAGESFRPVLVPPYNYLAPHLVGSVKSAGFSFVSCSGDFAGLQIASRNVHVDVIDWRRKQVAAPDRMVRGVIAALRLRRYGLVEATSPVGMITHHLVHDEPIWERTRCLLDRLAEHPAVSFPPLGEIFR